MPNGISKSVIRRRRKQDKTGRGGGTCVGAECREVVGRTVVGGTDREIDSAGTAGRDGAIHACIHRWSDLASGTPRLPRAPPTP